MLEMSKDVLRGLEYVVCVALNVIAGALSLSIPFNSSFLSKCCNSSSEVPFSKCAVFIERLSHGGNFAYKQAVDNLVCSRYKCLSSGLVHFFEKIRQNLFCRFGSNISLCHLCLTADSGLKYFLLKAVKLSFSLFYSVS